MKYIVNFKFTVTQLKVVVFLLIIVNDAKGEKDRGRMIERREIRRGQAARERSIKSPEI